MHLLVCYCCAVGVSAHPQVLSSSVVKEGGWIPQVACGCWWGCFVFPAGLFLSYLARCSVGTNEVVLRLGRVGRVGLSCRAEEGDERDMGHSQLKVRVIASCPRVGRGHPLGEGCICEGPGRKEIACYKWNNFRNI